jgi:hypothetical protein
VRAPPLGLGSSERYSGCGGKSDGTEKRRIKVYDSPEGGIPDENEDSPDNRISLRAILLVSDRDPYRFHSTTHDPPGAGVHDEDEDSPVKPGISGWRLSSLSQLHGRMHRSVIFILKKLNFLRV